MINKILQGFLILSIEGIEPGHIQGSLNLPYTKLTDPVSQIMKSPQELENLFKEANIDLNKPLVATCGSGVFVINKLPIIL